MTYLSSLIKEGLAGALNRHRPGQSPSVRVRKKGSATAVRTRSPSPSPHAANAITSGISWYRLIACDRGKRRADRLPGCQRKPSLLAFRMPIRSAGRTDTGRVRAQNQDALLQRPGRGLVAVADGMGGHAAGDIASRIAVDVLDDRTTRLPDAELPDYLRTTVEAAHTAILRAADADPELQGMGTTLTALLSRPDPGPWLIAHVGDSRAYRLREGSLEQLTRDQTWVQDQVDAGNLSPQQARNHPFSAMITSALGIREAELDVQVIEAEHRLDDLFLLCSDGLTAALQDDDIRSILVENPDLDAATDALVDAANQAGGPDNITVALIRGEAGEDGQG